MRVKKLCDICKEEEATKVIKSRNIKMYYCEECIKPMEEMGFKGEAI